jgi:hypothetical protein
MTSSTPPRRQACLSHLARNFQALGERPGACGEHGQRIRGQIDDVIRADTKARAGGQQIGWHTGPLTDIHDRLMDAVEAGERSRTPQLSRLCSTVLDIWPTLWNFTEHPDAEATNNRCARATATPSYGQRPALAPRPKPATGSSSGSSQSARPANSTTSPCTPTSPTPPRPPQRPANPKPTAHRRLTVQPRRELNGYARRAQSVITIEVGALGWVMQPPAMGSS